MKMKFAVVVLSGAVLMSGAALALDVDPSFYVDAEAQYNKLKNGNSTVFNNTVNGKPLLRKKNTPSLGLNLGSRITENFGLELGYNVLKQSKSTYANNSAFNVKMRNPYIDALGYIPMAADLDLIASIGLGRLSTKVDIKQNGVATPLNQVAKHDSKTKTGLRLGLGAQYKFDSNFGVRAMFRTQKGNKLVKNVNSAGLGLFYQF